MADFFKISSPANFPNNSGSLDFPDFITLKTFLQSSEKSCALRSILSLFRFAVHPTAVSQSPPIVFKKFLSAKAHISVS